MDGEQMEFGFMNEKPETPVDPMGVKLIHFTGKGALNEQWAAVDLLLFTKGTRLEMDPGQFKKIQALSLEEKMEQLKYMASTIPSSWEFVDYVFLVTGVSRAYTHQQVRTRAASYAQQSMRVVSQEGFEFIFTKRNLQDTKATSIIKTACHQIQHAYDKLQEIGQPVEDARGILPTNIATNIVCKFNMRTFVELAKSRAGGRTQGEYQRVIAKMIDVVLKVHPWMEMFLFGDRDRDYFAEIEAFAQEEFGDDLTKKGKLLKIVDKMRKE